jgi:hypothetical protein
MPGLQKTIASMVAGVVWALIAYSVSRALGRNEFVDALVYGVVLFGIVFQARLPLLTFTAGAIVGAGASMGASVRTVEGGIRVAFAFAIGALLGYAAEYAAGRMKVRGA